MKIWCVENDADINNLIIYAMQSAGYDAEGFVIYKDFVQALEKNKPDLIILNDKFPDIDGIDALKLLKQDNTTKQIPVIVLTAGGSEIDKVKTLDMGADDYVLKPFGVMELISRVRAVLRRASQKPEEDVVTFKDVTIYPSQHKVEIEGRRVELTLKEYNLLLLLVSNKGQVFTRKQLMDRVWGDSYVGESRTIDMHIKTLRQKLGADIIKTVRGVGYKAE